MKINVENRQSGVKIGEELISFLCNAVEMCMKGEAPQYDFEVGLTFVGSDDIRKLNKEFRDIDSPTDVLAFSLLEACNGNMTVNSGDLDMDSGLLQAGDIVIAPEKALEQALESGHSLESELLLLTIHGALHLLGYDHYDGMAENMFKKQEMYIQKANLMKAER